MAKEIAISVWPYFCSPSRGKSGNGCGSLHFRWLPETSDDSVSSSGYAPKTGCARVTCVTPRMTLVALCSLLSISFAHAQRRPVEAAFAAVPFQQWVAEGAKAELPWHPRIIAPKLTLHQRIAVQVEVELDGKELVKRCCGGQAVALVEINDEQGRIYRNYGGKDLKDVTPGTSEYNVSISWQIFLLPGEYTATIAFYYSGRNAHSLTTQRVHVGSLKHEPLPGSWRDLPAVEFCDPQPEGLDAFLLPNIAGRLHLPAKASRQIHLEILENVTPYPSERRRPSLYTDRLGVFLPILKTFGQLEIENGTVGVSLLEFTRRRVIFEQQDIEKGQISWTNLKDAMAANSVTAVDVHDLAQGERFGEFFRSEMERRLDEAGGGGGMRVFVVISGPMDLGTRMPVEIVPPAGDNFAVFYLRCDFLRTSAIVKQTPFFAGPVERSGQNMERLEDGVGKALRKLKPRVFPVDSAQGVREAIATILSDTSRM
jgi:hypothetical protein